jgi:hypothetical protein
MKAKSMLHYHSSYLKVCDGRAFRSRGFQLELWFFAHRLLVVGLDQVLEKAFVTRFQTRQRFFVNVQNLNNNTNSINNSKRLCQCSFWFKMKTKEN